MAEEHNLNIRARLDTSDIQAKLKNLNTNNPANGSTNSLSLNNVLLQLNNTLRSLQIAIRQMQASNGRQNIPQNIGNLRNNLPFIPAGSRAPAFAPPLQTRGSIPKAIQKLNAYDRNLFENNINEQLQRARSSQKAWQKLYNRSNFNKALRETWHKLDPIKQTVMKHMYSFDYTGLPQDVRGMRAITKELFGKKPSVQWAREQLAYGYLEPGAVGSSYKDFKKRMDLMFPKREHRLSRSALLYLGSNFGVDPLAGWAELQQLRGNETAAYWWKQGSNLAGNAMQGAGLGYMVGGPYGAGLGIAAGVLKTAVDAFIESLQDSARSLQEQTKLYEANVKAGSQFFEKYDLAEKNRLEDKALDAYQKNINTRSIETDLTKNKKELAGLDKEIAWLRDRAGKLEISPIFDEDISDDEKTKLLQEHNDEYKVVLETLQNIQQRRSKVLQNIDRLEGFKESQDKFLENETRAYYASLKADYPNTSIDDFQKTLSFNKKFTRASDAAGAAAFDAYTIAQKLASAGSDEYITRGIYEKRREALHNLVSSGNFNLNDYEQLKYSLGEARSEWQEAKAKYSALENIQNANNRFEINSLQDWISEIEKAISNLTRPDLSNVQSMASIGANMGENDINVERQMNYWAKTIELQTTMKNLLDKIEQKENSATFN